MNIAFLFNSDHPSLGDYYGWPVMSFFLDADVIQKLDRHMRVSLGDILTFGMVARSQDRSYAHLERLCMAVYRPVEFDRIKWKNLEETYTKATVYCWLFENMPLEAAQKLHIKLNRKRSYLGAMDVNFSYPPQLALFRNSLVEKYRFFGKKCSMFFAMGQNEDLDVVVKKEFEKHGFSVVYEDQGARRTIFDNFDTLEHFRRIEAFKLVSQSILELSEEQASDLCHNLEELHPKLFDAFAAAARTLDRAETEEDYAQVALSGRRLLEKTADYLFPPKDKLWNGRKIGVANYKNRLWAYIEKALTVANEVDFFTLNKLGKEADRLVDLFNAVLHADASREKTVGAFRDLVVWLSTVININPSLARAPYLAYEKELAKFFEETLKPAI